MFEGRAYQYKVLPFRLSLSPCVFTKVTETAIVPLRECGIRILNCLDNWLILALFRDQLCEHRYMVLHHLSLLGLRVNWEKSKLSPVQRISFLGMELDSVNQTARLTEKCVQSVLNCLNSFKGRTAAPLKLFQRLLGHMASTAAVTLLGLLHMRPLQRWLHGRVRRWAWQSGTHRVFITLHCRQTFSLWSDPSFLWAGVPLEQVSRHAVVFTDASATGWGATYNRHAVRGLNRTQIPLTHQLPRVASSTFCAGPPQRAATWQALADPYGQHCHRCVHQPPGWSMLPPHVATRPPSPPLESEASEVASGHSYPWHAQSYSRRALTTTCASGRVATPSPGGPADLGSLRSLTGRPVCLSGLDPLPAVLFPDRGHSRHGCEPSCTDPVQCQGGRGAGPVSCTILAQPDLVLGIHAPRDSPSLAHSSEEGPAFSEMGLPLVPVSRPLEASCLVPRWDAEVLGDLPQSVVNTITSARAPSTRHLYALKWNLFVDWCSSQREDP